MKEPNNFKAPILCQKAVELLKRHPPETALQLSETERLKLIQELEIHQIELEIQKEELNLANEKLEQQNENLIESLFHSNHSVMLLLDAETGDIKNANPAACHYYGWSHKLICDKNISEINIFSQAEIIDEIQKANNEKRNFFFFKHRLANGEIRDVEVMSSPLQINTSSFVYSFVHDITERKIAEAKLLKSEETYRKLVETINDVVYEITNAGIIKYVSPSIIRILGYSREEVIGKNILSYIYIDDRPMIAGRLSTLCERDYSYLEYRYISKNGSICWVRSSTSPIVEDGKLVGGTGTLTDITERKLAEQALLRNEALNYKMTANIGDVLIIFDLNGIISYKSQNVEKWFGWNPKEAIGVSIWEFVYPDDLNSTRDFIKTLYEETDANGKIEFRYLCKNGKYKWIEFTAANLLHDPDIQGILGNYHDITERIQAEKQLNLLSRAIEQSPVTVVITNKLGNIEYTNPKFTEITGYTLDEVKGLNPNLLQSREHSSEFYTELWNTILSGNDWHGEFQNRKKNGELYWESAVISSILDNQGDIAFFFAVKEDITDKKKMIADLINAKEKAEESDLLKSAFLANMSHEIRTPMNGILGFTDLLKEPNLSGEDQKEYIRIIEKSGARMLNIINDIIDISKIASGQINTTISEANINEQIEHIFSFFKTTVEQKGIQFFLKYSLPVNEANIKTDHKKFIVILSNLVKNAIKFTKTGSIEFGYEKKGEHLEFFVKDTGIGILSENMNIIFERFRQGSESNSRNYEGAGLGLSISKAYVEMLGGKIWVESEEEKGSTFYFTIPYINSVRS